MLARYFTPRTGVPVELVRQVAVVVSCLPGSLAVAVVGEAVVPLRHRLRRPVVSARLEAL